MRPAGATVTAALIALTVRFFGAFGALDTPVLFGTLVVAAATVVIAVCVRGARRRLPWRRAISLQTASLIVIACAAVCLATVAAYYLPAWQWDALAYHLPYLNFALQYGTASAGFFLAAAAFVLGPIDARRVMLAGVAIGLFLGTKPTAPLAVLILLAVLAFRARRMAASGANTPHAHGNLAARVVQSWTTILPPLPVFDMRVGGLGSSS